MFHVAAVQETARGKSIPAPIEGLDAVTPLSAMAETRAITLDNLFPQPGYLEIRRGHRTHADTGAAAVESLMGYHATSEANDKLFAATSTSIFDVTVTASVSSAVTGLANARWQHVNIATSGGQFLWCCNGADSPRYYNGTAWATATATGITATDIANCAVFKERLWVCLKDKLSPAYFEVDTIQGTAASFDLVGVFKKGGYLQAIGTWTLDGGNGPDDTIAFITSRGEVAVYQGIDPSSSTEGLRFDLKGVYEVGAPIGRRCLSKVGGDLAILSIDGVAPLSKALVQDRSAAIKYTVTAMIQPLVNKDARDYRTNFGWQFVTYPLGTRAVLNVPVTEGTEQRQYVMNTVTGAWCRFTGENANCWEVWKDRLWYGGNGGQVYEADCQGWDDDGVIEYEVETAFNYCDVRGRLKQFTMARALLTTDGQLSPGIAVNVDFSRNAAVDPTSVEVDAAALWDVATWDGGVWPEVEKIVTDWVSVAGEGYCASVKMAGSADGTAVSDPTRDLTLRINGWDILVLDGAFL